MKLTRKQIAVGAVALVVAGAAVVQMVWHPFGRTRALHARQVQLDLTYPDALIDSQSLSQLPRDVLRVPLLRDVLTEDFVAYYEGTKTASRWPVRCAVLPTNRSSTWRKRCSSTCLTSPPA